MSESKYSEEFKQQVVLEVVEKSRTISEVAKSYGLVPQTVGNWVNKRRKTHSGIEGEEMTAAQLAEYKKIKAELREARMEIDFRDKAVTLLRGGRTRLGRKNRRVLHAASQQISFNATRAGKNSSTGKIYRAERKAIRGHGIMD